MKLTAGLLNDTDFEGAHFGCRRVMQHIRNSLEVRGIAVSVAVSSATRWADNPELVKRLSKVDLILINAEGTLHHGRRKGRWLLDAVTHPASANATFGIVNALW